MLVLNAEQTAQLIDRDELRRTIGRAMVEVSAGRVSMPDRIAVATEDPTGFMAVMPAHVPALDALATKIVTVFPGNEALGLPSHQGEVLLLDSSNGSTLAMFDGAVITAERTAANAALSAEHLARDDAEVLTIVGTGVQARSHVHHVSRVRAFGEIRVAGRDFAKAQALVTGLADDVAVPLRAEVSIEAACRGADVVALTTHASTPVIDRRWLEPGTHVSSVGFSDDGREVDTATVADALLVVEQRSAAFAAHPVGSHDLGMPLTEGAIDRNHVQAEIGEVVSGAKPGRTDAEQITLYKSVGIAAQDAAAAKLLYDAALGH